MLILGQNKCVQNKYASAVCLICVTRPPHLKCLVAMPSQCLLCFHHRGRLDWTLVLRVSLKLTSKNTSRSWIMKSRRKLNKINHVQLLLRTLMGKVSRPTLDP